MEFLDRKRLRVHHPKKQTCCVIYDLLLANRSKDVVHGAVVARQQTAIGQASNPAFQKDLRGSMTFTTKVLGHGTTQNKNCQFVSFGLISGRVAFP